MRTLLERVGEVAGVFVGGGSPHLDFTSAPVLALVETGDTLIVIAFGSSLGTPGSGWTQRWSSGSWKAWTKTATAGEALPTLTASNGGADPAGALLVYRRATEGYVVGTATASSSAATMTHTTGAATVLDSHGLLLGVWLGAGGAAEPAALAAPISEILRQETSNASGGGVRWFVIGEREIAAVPSAGTLAMTTPGNQAMSMAIAHLRHRPPPAPAALVDVGAGANIGLLP